MQSGVAEGDVPVVWDGPIIAAMPVFNEEETIGSVILSCKPYVDTVFCVDDGSSDSSLESHENWVQKSIITGLTEAMVER